MPSLLWTKAQAQNNKRFRTKLDKITNYLTEGDWRGNFASIALANDDSITNYFATKEALSSRTIDFTRLQGGALKAKVKYKNIDGGTRSEEYIVGIQAHGNSFYMINFKDNEIAFGDTDRKSGVISLTFLGQSEANDQGLLAVVQYTDISGL